MFDLKESDVFWCTADVGWITGHSYLVYGALANEMCIRDRDRHVPNGMRGMLAVAQPPPLHCLGNSFASPCFIGTIAMASASFFPFASPHADAVLSTLPPV